VIEDFSNARVEHAETQRVYEMRLEDGRYVFRRYQLDDAGREINAFEVEVDWILGSGKHSRTYLYQTELGELYQLPIAWYEQTRSWAMAPGFELPVHAGVTRQVRRECMFCHNAYPEVPTGSDDYLQPQVFPANLPSGIDCQRCHGPGAAHVRVALGDDPTEAQLRGAIVNPARVPADRRRDVCYQCHMPKRRTQDVVEVVMTDHLIRRHPGGPELVAPLRQKPPVIVDVTLLDPEHGPPGKWPDVYRAAAVLRAGPSLEALRHLERTLPTVSPPRLIPTIELARALLGAGRTGDAYQTLRYTASTWPGSAEASDLLGVSLYRLGRTDEALASFAEALEQEPLRPETHFNLGSVLTAVGQNDLALKHLQRATELRPNMALAWLYLGRALEKLDARLEAAHSLQRALGIQPSLAQGYVDLARVLVALDRREDALRTLRHGAQVVSRPGDINAALESLSDERRTPPRPPHCADISSRGRRWRLPGGTWRRWIPRGQRRRR
jgi:Flp pilus assembly protein TadD